MYCIKVCAVSHRSCWYLHSNLWLNYCMCLRKSFSDKQTDILTLWQDTAGPCKYRATLAAHVCRGLNRNIWTQICYNTSIHVCTHVPPLVNLHLDVMSDHVHVQYMYRCTHVHVHVPIHVHTNLSVCACDSDRCDRSPSSITTELCLCLSSSTSRFSLLLNIVGSLYTTHQSIQYICVHYGINCKLLRQLSWWGWNVH